MPKQLNGQYLRSIRQARGLSLEDVAVEAGVHFSTVAYVESGRIQKAETLSAIENAIHTAVRKRVAEDREFLGMATA